MLNENEFIPMPFTGKLPCSCHKTGYLDGSHAQQLIQCAFTSPGILFVYPYSETAFGTSCAGAEKAQSVFVM